MVLKGKTKITQSRHARTQYVTIPATIVADSQYPFTTSQEVEIKVDPERRKIEIVAASTVSTSAEESSEGS